MLDGTRFHLGKNANAILSDFAYNETAKVGNFDAFVIRGGFHYKSGKIGKMFAGASKSHSTISTPTAIIGIRGSECDGNVDRNGITTIVHRSGVFSVTDINGQNEVVADVFEPEVEHGSCPRQMLFDQNLYRLVIKRFSHIMDPYFF